MEIQPCKVIGYYVTEKKNAKMNWAEFGNVCRNHGFSLLKINLQVSLEAQGPFFAIIHKLTEVIMKASQGDSEAAAALQNVESYIKSHPEVIVVDPLDAVRRLLDRSRYYSIVQNLNFDDDKVFTPSFVDLTSTDVQENIQRLKDADVTYPFVCKPLLGHGSEAHQMAVVFNERGVADCKPPCVAQSFINHNAVLYKLFFVGDNLNVAERPSLKNFSASDQNTILFSTCDVSKADSRSSLTVLDPEDAAVAPPSKPDTQCLQHILSPLRRELGMMLLGVDVVIEHGSGRYGIIDINIFPGYEGFPDFFQCLMNNIVDTASKKTHTVVEKARTMSEEAPNLSSGKKQVNARYPDERSVEQFFLEQKVFSAPVIPGGKSNKEYDQDDSGFDTGDSSDERKKNWCLARGRGGHGRKLAQQVKGFLAPGPLSAPNNNESFVRAGLDGV